MVQHIIRADILLIARIFPRPCGARKILRNSQNIRTYYMLNHRIRCIHFIFCSFVYLATHEYIPARSYCDTHEYLLPLHDYALVSFKYRFLLLVLRGNSISFNLLVIVPLQT